jgi:hypothetical protein
MILKIVLIQAGYGNVPTLEKMSLRDGKPERILMRILKQYKKESLLEESRNLSIFWSENHNIPRLQPVSEIEIFPKKQRDFRRQLPMTKQREF